MPIDAATRRIRLHIGHHFFGAGNLGDDLMLGGFLAAVARRRGPVDLSCACPFDLSSQRRRFPQVDWQPYDAATRERLIAACDAWVGLGGTPFQNAVGPWFLDHLAGEARLCGALGKPMYCLGIGVSEPGALDDPRSREFLDRVSHVWTRDSRSAELVAAVTGGGKVSAAADLAHVYLRDRSARQPVESGVMAYVLNFEDPRMFSGEALCAFIEGSTHRRHRWLVQEVRPLDGSERAILDALPVECRQQMDLRIPPYADGSLDELVAGWGSPQWLLTSRYHAAVIGAWSGARGVSVERSEKIRGLVAQLQTESVPDLNDPATIAAAVERARVVDRQLLQSLAGRAAEACERMMDQVAANTAQ